MANFIQNMIVAVIVLSLIVFAGTYIEEEMGQTYNITPEKNLSSLNLINSSLDRSAQMSEEMYNSTSSASVFVIAASGAISFIKIGADSFKLVNKLLQEIGIWWGIPLVVLSAASALLILYIGFELFRLIYLRISK